MQDSTLIRRFEPWFLAGTAILYVGRRLFVDVNRLDEQIDLVEMNGVPLAAIWQQLANYDHTLNNNVPLIAGACLFVVAWFVFHALAYPKIQQRIDDPTGWAYVGITVLLLLATTFVFHFLKLYVRNQYDQAGQIIGLSVYSLYRKRTVLADAVGLGIVFGAYEILVQYYQYLSRKIPAESVPHFRVVSYLLLAGLMTKLFVFAVTAGTPLPLWSQRMTRNGLMLLGLGIQVVVLQHYVYTYILPLLAAPRRSEEMLFRRISLYMLLIGVATLIVWGAATGFYYDNRDPILLMFVVLIGSVSIAYGRQVLSREKTALQTQVSTKSAELASLRAQINPHFLFNALNSLYATALKENSEKTADGIQKLGDMMRFMLHENNRDRISLDKEIEYLHNYILLQRMRIDETHNIDIRVNIQEPDRPIYVAPMMLIPFVENAFKHGISFRQPSWIYITLTLDDTQLYFKVHNSRHPKPTDSTVINWPEGIDPESEHPGVGLDNVLKRLALLYPDRHQFTSQQSQQDYFISLILTY